MRHVILGTLAEQEAEKSFYDLHADPAGIDLSPFEGAPPAPIFAEGKYNVPESVIGFWSDPKVEDGRLTVEVTLNDPYTFYADKIRYSFAGIAAGGVSRLIAVHAFKKEE